MQVLLKGLGFADITPPSNTEQLLAEQRTIARRVNRGEISRVDALQLYQALKERAVTQ